MFEGFQLLLASENEGLLGTDGNEPVCLECLHMLVLKDPLGIFDIRNSELLISGVFH